MAITLPEQKALVGFGAFLVGVLFLRRLLAGKGDVFIDRVEEEPATWDEKDDSDAELSELQRRAVALLAVDLDLMEPTHSPSPNEVLDIQDTIRKLRTAGKTGEADNLSKLLRQAQSPRGGES